MAQTVEHRLLAVQDIAHGLLLGDSQHKLKRARVAKAPQEHVIQDLEVVLRRTSENMGGGRDSVGHGAGELLRTQHIH